jgi:hypothetical protein
MPHHDARKVTVLTDERWPFEVVVNIARRVWTYDLEVQMVGFYESEPEARDVAKTRDKHLAEARPEVKWQPHAVHKTEPFKAATIVQSPAGRPGQAARMCSENLIPCSVQKTEHSGKKIHFSRAHPRAGLVIQLQVVNHHRYPLVYQFPNDDGLDLIPGRASEATPDARHAPKALRSRATAGNVPAATRRVRSPC